MNAWLAALCLSLPLAAAARPGGLPLDARMERAAFEAMGEPVVLDRKAARAELEGLTEQVRALRQVLGLLGKRERGALEGQLEQIDRRVAALRATLADGAPVQRAAGRLFDRPAAEPTLRPATGAELAAIESSLGASSFGEDKLRVLRAAAASHHFTTAQAERLVAHLSFGADKVEALAALHPRLVDPEKFHTLYRLLHHAADREALEARIGRR